MTTDRFTQKRLGSPLEKSGAGCRLYGPVCHWLHFHNGDCQSTGQLLFLGALLRQQYGSPLALPHRSRCWNCPHSSLALLGSAILDEHEFRIVFFRLATLAPVFNAFFTFIMTVKGTQQDKASPSVDRRNTFQHRQSQHRQSAITLNVTKNYESDDRS